MTLFLVRHAKPLIAEGVCYGALDVAAEPQATALAAQSLALTLPKNVRLLCSPLQRCAQLAEALCNIRPDLLPETDGRLAEMNFGAWEGQRWDAIAPSELRAWTDAFNSWCCGGAESVEALLTRVGALWDDGLLQDRPTAWITHAGVIRAVSLVAQGIRRMDNAADWPINAPRWGEWITFNGR